MKLSRRRLGAVIGGATIGAALLPQWMRSVRAQATAAPVRFLAVRSPHGVDRDYWIPRPPGGGEPGAADMDLMELTFEYESSILGPLMPFRSKITVLDGLDTQIVKGASTSGPVWDGGRPTRGTYGFHGHNEQGCVLTGAQPPGNRDSGNYDNHPSLDFYLHDRLPAPALLTASVEGTGLPWKNMSYDASGVSRTPTTSPNDLFRQAFPEDFTPPTSDAPAIDYGAGEQLIHAYGEGALMRWRERLAGSERDKIDRHMAAMAALVQGPGGGLPVGMCMTSGADGPGRGGEVRSAEDVVEVARAHARVIAQAFACGRARNATLQILNDYPNWHTHLPEVQAAISALYDARTFRYHENLVHDYWMQGLGAARRAAYTAGLRWNATHFAAVLEELDAIIDPLDPAGGTILDNTIVFWHNEFGHEGHDMQHTRHPAIIAGGGGKVLKIGRYLRLRNIQSEERVPHNRLLVSIAHAVGVTDLDYFGDRDFAGNRFYSGPLTPLMA